MGPAYTFEGHETQMASLNGGFDFDTRDTFDNEDNMDNDDFTQKDCKKNLCNNFRKLTMDESVKMPILPELSDIQIKKPENMYTTRRR
jgi:hypothetical protein